MTGDYKAAIDTFRQLLTDYETARVKTPNDTGIAYFLWVIKRRLAETLEKSGDYQSAAEHFQTALSIIENLSAESPKDIGYRRNSAATHILFGQLLIKQKQLTAASAHFRRAVILSGQILESNTDYTESKIDLARADGNLGNILLLNGNREEGLSCLKKAVSILAEDGVFDSDNAELKRDYDEFRGHLLEE